MHGLINSLIIIHNYRLTASHVGTQAKYAGCVITYFFRLDFIFQLRHSIRVPGKFVDPLLIFVCDVHIFNRLQTWEKEWATGS